MPRLDVQIPAPDGTCPGTLPVPDGDGHPESWPGVIIFPDAGGARETIRQMGDHAAQARHWDALARLYRATLAGG